MFIKGEVTPEQLLKAFAAAVKKLEEDEPGAKFYGANLYLTPHRTDGRKFENDHRMYKMGISIPPQPGTLVKPALTAEGQQRIDAERDAQRQQELLQAERNRADEAEYKRKRQGRIAQEANAQTAYDALNVLTSKLLASDSERLINSLNEVIRTTWFLLEPKEQQGPRKGEPKPMPVFSTGEGRLMLWKPGLKNQMFLFNPVGRLNGTVISPNWTFAAWLTVIDGFLRVMEQLSGSPLPEQILGDHLPVQRSIE